MLAGRFMIFAVLCAAALAPPGASYAQEVRLGSETRTRKLSIDTLSGRRVTLVNGRWFEFRRDGRYSRNNRDGDTRSGTWSIAHENVVNLTSRRGETQQLFFVTIEGRLYLRDAGRKGHVGRMPDLVSVVKIEAAD